MTESKRTVITIFVVLFSTAVCVSLLIFFFGRSESTHGENHTSSAYVVTVSTNPLDIKDGRTIMEKSKCFSCHSINGAGGTIAPSLNGVRYRKTPEMISQWIKSPGSIKPGTAMPQYPFSDEQIAKIVSYLETVDSLHTH
ncbi:MAG: cytochrome c [Bacteroidota bacterium]|nr:cytochrome c [Bacteroidota bacterium]